MERIPVIRSAMATLLVLWLFTAPAQSQVVLPDLGGFGGAEGPPKAEVTAQFYPPQPDRSSVLAITVDLIEGFHIYSITQKPGGPVATKLKLDPSKQYSLKGKFQANKLPKVHVEEKVWPGLPLEEHYGKITWVAPIELAEGVDPRKLEITGLVDMQVCDPGTCVPLQQKFTAKLAKPGSVPPKPATPEAGNKQAASGEYRAERSSALVRGMFENSSVPPGGKTNLRLSVVPNEGWHTYALAPRDPRIVGKGKPTLIVLESPKHVQLGPPVASQKPISKPSALDDGSMDVYHQGQVTWTVEITVPSDTEPGTYPIAGIIGYQVCENKGYCQQPQAARFEGDLVVANGPAGTAAGVQFRSAKYAEAAMAAAERSPVPAAADPGDQAAGLDLSQLDVDEGTSGEEYSLGGILVLAFFGGLILNLMPCVLPVIGLKVMSFVEQAGHSRRDALILNAWYSLGLISVFMVLATLAAVAGLSWGGQFGSATFNIVLTGVVFAMALSLLGVWEIPIPGFIGGGSAIEMAEKEGPSGAFIKGVITTVLATPCTGPFMGTALGWAVLQPATTTFAVFFCLGLGMASPYLLIGAFPQLLRFLPKPGAWMSTFKQVMGFILLGTVVFLLTIVNSLHPALVIPTLTMLVGIGAACWWINRTPLTADLDKKIAAWTTGGLFAAAVTYLAFGWLYSDVLLFRYNRHVAGLIDTQVAKALAEQQERLAQGPTAKPTATPAAGDGEHWPAFTVERLQQLAEDQKTVLVDFSADWCTTCKLLERTVLHTEAVENAIKKNGIVTLYADFTAYPPEIKQVLNQLGSDGVPVIAIFPADAPNKPIVFRGGYTSGGLLAAIQRAGPSKPDSDKTASAAPAGPPSTRTAANR